jgi:hypothetical protein
MIITFTKEHLVKKEGNIAGDGVVDNNNNKLQ